MKTLDELKKEELELNNQLIANQEEQRLIKKLQFLAKYNIAIGDIIEYKERDKLIIGRLEDVEFIGTSLNYPMVRLYKKDGTFGKRKVRVWYSSLSTLKKHIT